jgi:hypothetical protein
MKPATRVRAIGWPQGIPAAERPAVKARRDAKERADILAAGGRFLCEMTKEERAERLNRLIVRAIKRGGGSWPPTGSGTPGVSL